MDKHKCGCRSCKKLSVPTTRNGWKSLKNKKGFSIGTTRKVTKGKNPQLGKRSQLKMLK